MTAAVVTLALALAGALVVIALLVRAHLKAVPDLRASFAAEVLAGKAQIAAELAQRGAEREKEKAEGLRDEALVRAAKAEAEAAAANAAYAASQEALNKLVEENGHAAVTAIRSAPSADAARAHLELLLKAAARPEAGAVPEAGGPGSPATVDRGD